MSSLIELGAGFHPELSGRDNIFLNGAILGLSRREIQRKLDEIVAFSELERFIDTPVKRYSSGMYVRLGFAVAAYVEPDVLLVDEVLAVGDSAFRQKCMTRMELLRQRGATLIFVSHNMHQVRRLCNRAVLLNSGQAVFQGPTGEAISTYEETIHSAPGSTDGSLLIDEATSNELFITQVQLSDPQGNPVARLRSDQSLEVRIDYQAIQAVQEPVIKIRLTRADGTVIGMTSSSYWSNLQWTLQGAGSIRVCFEPIQVVSGKYMIEARIIDTTDTRVLASGMSDPFMVLGPAMPHETDLGSFLPHATWSHDTDKEAE